MSDDTVPAVRVFDTLSEAPEEVRALLRGDGSRDPFLTEDWFDLLLRHSPIPGRALRLYGVGGRTGAVDGVLLATGGRGDAWYARRELSSLSNFYTMRFAPILGAGVADPAPVLDALVAGIARERPAWDVIHLRSLIAEDPLTDQLVQAFRRGGMAVDTYFQFENWYHPTAGVSAQQYFDSRPSQLRNTVRRKAKKASKEHAVAFRLYSEPGELPQGLCDYAAVYAKSWKMPERYPDFIPNMLRRCATRGILRLGIYYVDEVPAAAQIWIVTKQRAIIYKLAYDETYAALSVGSILTKLMFDHILDNDKVAEVDYGVGSEPYKLDWMSCRRHVVGLIAFNPRSLGGQVGAAVHRAGGWWRRFRHRDRAPEEA